MNKVLVSAPLKTNCTAHLSSEIQLHCISCKKNWLDLIQQTQAKQESRVCFEFFLLPLLEIKIHFATCSIWTLSTW